MSSKSKNKGQGQVGAADGATPASTPAAASTPAGAPVVAAPPVVGAKPHTKADLEAAIAAGRARGPLADNGSVAGSPSMTRLLKEHPEDTKAFLRDGNGALCVFDLTSEKGKKALLRRSAGPSQAWFVVRTSDVHQQRFERSEKPRGSKRGAKALPAAAGVDLSKVN